MKTCFKNGKVVVFRPVPKTKRRGLGLAKNSENMQDVLKQIAPGTPIRNGLENILNAKTGALIAVADTQEVLDLVDGGFKLDVDYSAAKLYELAKMDGAIILSSDFKRILYANTQLIPSPDIYTTETRDKAQNSRAYC